MICQVAFIQRYKLSHDIEIHWEKKNSIIETHVCICPSPTSIPWPTAIGKLMKSSSFSLPRARSPFVFYIFCFSRRKKRKEERKRKRGQGKIIVRSCDHDGLAQFIHSCQDMRVHFRNAHALETKREIELNCFETTRQICLIHSGFAILMPECKKSKMETLTPLGNWFEMILCLH